MKTKTLGFLKPTKQKGKLTLILIIFYYLAYFAGNQIAGMLAKQIVSAEAILKAIQPVMPELMSQLGTILKMVAVLFAIQFIFILVLAYVFACTIVHLFRRKK